VNDEERFLASLPLAERVITFVCRRHHLSPDEADEFAGVVRLKLVEHQYSVFRAFEGRSSIQTYLTVVIQRLFLDFRISRWGKWRPSAEARRQGPTAILLERLTSRDGLSFGEACEVMRTNHGVTLSDAELEATRAVLPHRSRRRTITDEVLEQIPGHEPDGETIVLHHEAVAKGARGYVVLGQALSDLPGQDRLIIRLRFENGLQVSQIARLLRVDQKQLYRRIDAILRGLRSAMESKGISQEEVSRWLDGDLPAREAPVTWRDQESARSVRLYE
jgi:RNA polymerase sigma factor (sigma-70 family)